MMYRTLDNTLSTDTPLFAEIPFSKLLALLTISPKDTHTTQGEEVAPTELSNEGDL